MNESNDLQDIIRAELTPMMKQWYNIKKNYPDHIIFFRAGDFYETFYKDAKIASRVLNITLTAKKLGDRTPIPMAGVPYHSVDSYLTKMVEKGYKVAIVEQLEDASEAKTIVKRGVTQLITRGTITLSESFDKKNNYLVALSKEESSIGFSALDLSTGEFLVTSLTGHNSNPLEKLEVEITRLSPSEIIVEQNLWKKLDLYIDDEDCTITFKEDYYFDIEQGKEELCRHFETLSLSGFGVDDYEPGVGAAGACLRYVKETQMRNDISNITKISPIRSNEHMILDANSIRSLELVENLNDRSTYGTLLSILDNTESSAGSRLLTSWILRPSFQKQIIEKRLDSTEEIYNDIITREDLRNLLKDLNDMERIIGRICLGRCKPRDVLALKSSLKLVPEMKKILEKFKCSLIKEIHSNLDPIDEVVSLIDRSIADEVPSSIKSGNVIRNGYNEELDSYREIRKNGKQYLASLEAREKKKTNIKSLKVKFNKVFGYFIEIPNTYSSNVPDEYERKQTLVNSERFFTPELKEYETKILNAEEKMLILEEQLFMEILREIAKYAERIQNDAYYYALIDVICTFAHNGSYYNYCKPKIVEEEIIDIADGRHPVVEQLLKTSSFIPNNCVMKQDEERILIITGPNMAGKSTYLRQVALIILMAHMGSYVPCSSATIGLTDRIFTRIGAHDVLVEHRSTFMQEMYETANIVNNATDKSFIILDEVGRGTSTFDGISIAWALTEYLHNNIGKLGPRTLFATHYHELIELEHTLPRAKNYHVAAKDVDGDIHFLYKVKSGGMDESYGVHVASLAGLPERIIERSNIILSMLHEKINGDEKEKEIEEQDQTTPQRKTFRQVTLLGHTSLQKASTKTHSDKSRARSDGLEARFIDDMSSLDVNKLTPIEAINLLDQLVRKSKKISRNK